MIEAVGQLEAFRSHCFFHKKKLILFCVDALVDGKLIFLIRIYDFRVVAIDISTPERKISSNVLSGNLPAVSPVMVAPSIIMLSIMAIGISALIRLGSSMLIIGNARQVSVPMMKKKRLRRKNVVFCGGFQSLQ